MSEYEQLLWITTQARDFWEMDNCRSTAVTGGISVEISGSAGAFQWIVTWLAREPASSDRRFNRLQDAKNDLRRFLREHLEQVADAMTHPAQVSF